MINNLFNQLNISNIDNGNDESSTIDNISIIITSTKNQKNNENKKMLTINLGECETILKDKYNISKDDSLYMLQIISEEEKGMKIPKIEYEVYYPSNNNNNLTKLNLSLCKNTKIEISIPVKIDDNIDKYNPKSAYYNDICYKTTSESGTDISLKDRKNEFVENNMTLCEENCEFIDYNYNIEKVKCSCEIKTHINTNYDFKFNKNEFFKSFVDIKNLININILKCYKIVLNIKDLTYNYGFYIINSIMFLFLLTLIIFCLVSNKKLKKDLLNMFLVLNNIKSINLTKSIVKGKENLIKKKFKKNKKLRTNKKRKNININNHENNNINDKNALMKNNNDEIKYLSNIKQTTKNEKNKSFSNLNMIKILKLKSYDISVIYANELLKQRDFELNSLKYEKALILDKRSYFQYYISLLKYNHPLFFSFYAYNDYNSQIIKIFLFFFSFSSDLTINALFFNDDTMHKIYQDKGKYNLLYQIPQILYSTLISRLIDTLIKNFALYQDNIIEFKKEKRKNNLDKKYAKILHVITVKIILFFVLAFIILSFFWYYIICFLWNIC